MSQPIPAGLSPGVAFQDRYQIVRCIKAGGMGAVYEVIDQKTASRRALKVMLPSLLASEGLRARFEIEAKITGAIDSDHLVRVLDAGVDQGSDMPFLVMELLRGEDLAAVTQARGSIPPDDVAVYLIHVARALDKTHAAGIVHRDLKPENLFLTHRDDGSPCVKVLDFGIAKAADFQAASVETRPMMGTPLYMSPEQIRAEKTISPGTDIYSLAHIAYTLLTGEPYWRQEFEAAASPYLLAVAVMGGIVEPPSGRALRRKNIAIPSVFDAWFLKATAQQPSERFERASHAVQALGQALGTAPQPAGVVADALADTLVRPIQPPIVLTSPTPKKPEPEPEPEPARQAPSDAQSGVGMTKKKGFIVAIDPTRNIVRVKVWGFWTIDDAKAYWDEFKAKADMVAGRPWYVLADIGDFAAQKPDVNVYVEKTMSYARSKGMVRAANLVSSALSKMQISRLSQETGLPSFSFFQSESDAIRWLITAA